jgi:hypothetical protein
MHERNKMDIWKGRTGTGDLRKPTALEHSEEC